MLSDYILFAILLKLCSSFVLISSATSLNQANLYEIGDKYTYTVHSTVSIDELFNQNGKNLEFFINGNLDVEIIGGSNSENSRLIKFQLNEPKLYTKSSKSNDFNYQNSKLGDSTPQPFYGKWSNGKFEHIFYSAKEPISLVNFEKGLMGLFQFQLFDGEHNETDASGECLVSYQSLGPNSFEKSKQVCNSAKTQQTNDEFLGLDINSIRQAKYELKNDIVQTIHAKESHVLMMKTHVKLNAFVKSETILNFVEKSSGKPIEINQFDELVEEFTKEKLKTHPEHENQQEISFSSLASLMNELRPDLKSDQLGSVTSARAFLKLYEAMKNANVEKIGKVLQNKKNERILPQIYDVLGYIQDENVHDLVMKRLHFDKEDHLDNCERYLWALSLSPRPNVEIIKDLLGRWKKGDNFGEKISETLLLTLAAMARQASHLSQNYKVLLAVKEAILNGLDYAKNEQRFPYLRALKNLKSPQTVSLLLDLVAESKSNKEAVLAMKALRSFDPVHWDEKVVNQARRTFLQLDRKYDSSARTLAVDILLHNPSEEILGDMVDFLKRNETVYEVKQYLYQQLKMLADENDEFQSKLSAMIKKDGFLNNYSGLAPRGLSTAFKRSFMQNAKTNGSLVTVQEISSGIVKRGVVAVLLEKDNMQKELIGLGIFASGLSSMVSSASVDEDEAKETATAGMELTILDRQIRPFVFFTGQGELMGHVWSGTASEKTTAYQSSILLNDFQLPITLANGFTAKFQMHSAASFDLSGKIEISLWGRTAESLVEKSAGLVSSATIEINSEIIDSKHQSSATLEPKLTIQSDIDFSGGVNLCMRVTQPNTSYQQKIITTEKVPGTEHKRRLIKTKSSPISGKTYSLNRINNEMCSAMFR